MYLSIIDLSTKQTGIKIMKNIKKGDTIKLKAKWMDQGDEKITFIATEDFDADLDDTLYIVDANSKLAFPQHSLIRKEMIEN